MTPDGALLGRIERRAIWVTVACAALSLALPHAGPPVAAAVFGGALLIAVSYWAIKRGVGGLTTALLGGADPRSRASRSLIILVGRYALLALIAYVMIARLRLSPVGLLLGASVIPIAVAIEALATLRKTTKKDGEV